MKKIDGYQCEICRNIYSTENMAKLCEGSHKKISKIYDPCWNELASYPVEIKIEFDDKNIVTYKISKIQPRMEE